MSTVIHPSPSLTTNEEDIANRSLPFHEHDDFVAGPQRVPSKGKEREMRSRSSTPEDASSSDQLEDVGYPPTNEEAAETRRIEENLRKWEITERQRRKAARGSSQSSNTPSIMSDVTKRASLLWTSRKAKNTPPSGIGTHTALQSSENIDIVPLNQISPAHSPTRSSSLDSTATSTYAQNPFEHPEDSSQSISTSHTNDTITLADQSSVAGATLLRTQTRSHPPPQPLNLPPPRTPPPTVLLVPSPPPEGADLNKRESEVRWWHDWLCGCGEGKDRGGDHQAGRTNPFE